MIRFIITLLALIAIAVTYYVYGYKTGYTKALGVVFVKVLDKAIARGFITTKEEVEDFARQYIKTFYESEDE